MAYPTGGSPDIVETSRVVRTEENVSSEGTTKTHLHG